MPITIKRDNYDYISYLEKEKVEDVPAPKQKGYPVVCLCRRQDYEIAVALIKKGYKCIHEEKFNDLYTIIQGYRLNGGEKISPYTSSESIKQELIDLLNNEFESMREEDITKLVVETREVLSEWNSQVSRNIDAKWFVAFMREYMPAYYRCLVESSGDCRDDRAVKMLVNSRDKIFINDYINHIFSKMNRMNYVNMNRWDENEERDILKRLMGKNMDEVVNTLEDYWDAIMFIQKMIPMFYAGFICDMTIIYQVLKLRVAAITGDDVEIMYKCYKNNSEYGDAFQKLEYIVQEYMPEHYRITHVFEDELKKNYTN